MRTDEEMPETADRESSHKQEKVPIESVVLKGLLILAILYTLYFTREVLLHLPWHFFSISY